MSGPSGWEPIGSGGSGGGSSSWEPLDSSSMPSASTTSSGSGHGFLHDLGGVGHTIATQASRAGHLIAATPGGLAAQFNTAVIQPWWATFHGHNAFDQKSVYQKNIGKVIDQNVNSIQYTLDHPGENWLATAMLAAPALHGVGRAGLAVGEGSAALKAGEGVRGAVDVARNSKVLRTQRMLTQPGGDSVTLNTSRNTLRRAYQAAHDAYVQRMIDTKPNSAVAKYGASRIHGSLAEISRARVRMHQAVTSNLRSAAQPVKGEIAKTAKNLGLELKNSPKTIAQAAIELVSHNTTPEEAILRAEHAIENGVNPELNAANIDLYREIDNLDLVHTLGADVGINPDYAKTAKAEAILHEGGTALDAQIAERGLRPADQLEKRKNLPAAVTQRLKPFAEPKVTAGLRDASTRFERIDRLYRKALQQEHDWHYKNTEDVADAGMRTGGKSVDLNNPYRERVVTLGHLHEDALQRLQRLETRSGKGKYSVVPDDLQARSDLVKFATQKFGQEEALNRVGLLDRRAGQFGRENDIPASEFYKRYLKELQTSPTLEHFDGLLVNPLPDLPKEGGAVQSGYEPGSAAMAFSEKHAIPETITHEALHAVRQSLPELLQRKFENRYGVKDGQWTRADEEHFVNDMLGVHNGTITDPELVRNFHQLTEFVPGRTFTPLRTLEHGTPASIIARAQGPVIGLAKDPLDTHFTTGSGLLAGRHQEDVVDAVARHWHNVFRFFNTQDWRDMVAKTGSDVRRSDRDILARVDNRTEGGVPIHAEKLTSEIETLLGRVRDTSYTPQMEGEDAGILASLEGYVSHLFPGKVEDFADTPIGEKAPAGYKWVDSNVVGDVAPPRLGQGNAFGRFFDNVNAAVTAATVYFKLGHFLTRVLTNAATNIMQGSASPLNIKDSLGVWHELSPNERLDALAASGTHYYESIPGAQGDSRVARIVQHGIGPNHALAPEWWAKVVDAPFRFNSLSYEVRKSAFGGGAEGMRSFLSDLHNYNHLDEAQRAEVDGVVRRANQQAIAYDRLNATERNILSRAIWFYPWVKGSSVWTMQQLFEHPWKSAYLANAGVAGMQQQKAEFGDLPSYSYGLLELAHGTPFPLVADFSTFNPAATAGDVLQAPQHLNDLADMANPALGTVEHLATSTDQYGNHTNRPITSALEGLVSATPESQIAQAYAGRHTDQSHREFPGGPQNDPFSKTWLGEILRALVGPGTPRRFNPEAAHSLAQRERTGR